MRFNDTAAPALLMLDPELNFGELYMDGRIEVTNDTIFDVLMLNAANMWRSDGSLWVFLLGKTRSALRRLRHSNDLLRARRNVSHHYDLDAIFYTRFLDSGLQYSCAYFERDGQNLEGAQLAKKRHIAAKLVLEPGQNVLDIGCGFGDMAIYLARFCGASVTGLTLSQIQVGIAKAGAADLGLTGATDFRLSDYREFDGRFDRIVSVGCSNMWASPITIPTSKKLHLLDEDGVALIHTIRSPPFYGEWNDRIAPSNRHQSI